MGAPTCLLVAFAVLLAAQQGGAYEAAPWEGAYEADGEGVSVNAEHATQVEEAPAEEKPVEEGSWTEWIENKVTEAEEGVSEVVEEVEEGAENVKEEVEEVVEHPIATVEEAVGIGGDDAHHGEELSNPTEERDDNTMLYSEVHPFIQHQGFIPELKGRDDSKMDLHWDHMTVHEAKQWCVEHAECAGFHHLGPAEEGPFEMTFKDYWEIDSEHEDENGHPTPHTSYRKSATPFYNEHEEHAPVDEEHDPLHMLQKEKELEAERNSETVSHLAKVEPEEEEVHANNWKTMDHEWHEAGEGSDEVAAPTAKQFRHKPRAVFLDKLPSLLDSKKSRFNVGDKVMIMIDCMPGNCDHLRQGTKGMVGEVIEHDGSDQPYKIRFHNGNEAWYKPTWVTEVSDSTLKLMGNHAHITDLNSWHDEH